MSEALKAVVVYDSMWGSTARMARAVGEGLGVQYAPDDAALKRCFDLGQAIAEKLPS